MAYALFFPTLFYLPRFDYVQYSRYTDLSMFKRDTADFNSPSLKESLPDQIPAGRIASLKKVGEGLSWIGISVTLSGISTLNTLTHPSFVERGLITRLWYLHAFAFQFRCTLYGVWALVDAALTLTGITYSGYDHRSGQPRWDSLQNVEPIGIELAQNPRAYVGNWNIKTHEWLKQYVYIRIAGSSKKTGVFAVMATFFISALSHGFCSGYYATFALAGLITVAGKCKSHIPISTAHT